MTAHEQTDLFGGSVPLEELDLAGHSRRLAQAERERGHALTADEAGALIHAARGKHPEDARCTFCGGDGFEALARFRSRSKVCEGCGRTYHRTHKDDDRLWNRRRHCSRECRFRGPAVIARVIAEETRVQNGGGYIQVFCPWHPSSQGGYVYEHRLIAERKLGRLLEPGEQVHHRNEDVSDNRPENLEVMSAREHRVHHGSGLSEEQIADLIREGKTSREIAAMGVGTHRIVRARQLVETPEGWTCGDCSRVNPPDAVFCRGCASTQDDDTEPVIGASEYDPATAPFPEGF